MNRFTFLSTFLILIATNTASGNALPNILWIVVEDASAHFGAYGERTIQTPHLDRLAQSSILFENAFVTCPVCSPSRSAMVTGMYQTTLGAHNHRSQSAKGKGRGGDDYLASYELPIPTIPRLFQDAGYYTCNSATGLPGAKAGKTDYNFVWNPQDYDGSDWQGRQPDQPFFAQVQLRGGKNRRAHRHGTDPAQVQLPPYYPDHPVLRKDWADYLNSWVQVDEEVNAILQRLEHEGIADRTAIFFWTDHGVSHLRGKQFLYDEGIHVPLLVRLPGGTNAGTRRDDLVLQIDVAATSLELAGIELPDFIHGRDLLADNYQPREMIVCARDRCDETTELMRCVRTRRYKYIRNFLPHLPHAQPNQYKDQKQIIKTMRQLNADERLNALQARPFSAPRPTEELYDLKNDPFETHNLAKAPEYGETLQTMRMQLANWMTSSRDVGMIPEPVLEEMGRAHKNKYNVLTSPTNRNLISDILRVVEAGEQRDLATVVNGLGSNQAAIRYWAATQLGVYGNPSFTKLLRPLTEDPSAAVRVAAVLALCRLGESDAAKLLTEELTHDNLTVGMQAIRALELIGEDARPYAAAIRQAEQSQYEFTRRIARRLTTQLQDTCP